MLYAVIGFLIALTLVYGYKWLNDGASVKKDVPAIVVLSVIGLLFAYFLPIVLNGVFNLFKPGDQVSPWVLVILSVIAGFASQVFILPLFIKKTQV
jgi:hypothetical protein